MKESMSIQKNAFYVSLFLTTILWIILMSLFAFAPLFQEEERYRPIQIMLESPKEIDVVENFQEVEKPKPVVPIENAPLKEIPKTEISPTEKPIQKSLDQTSPASVKQSSVESKPSEAVKSSSVESASSSQAKNASSVQKGVSQSTKKEPVQPASSSATSAVENSGENSVEKSPQNAASETSTDSEKRNITYKKSLDELLEEQSSSKEKAQWDESLFAGDSVKEASSQESINPVGPSATLSGGDALSGTAGTLSAGNGGAVAQVDKPSLQSEVSSETRARLNRIAEITYNAPAINGVTSSVSVNSATDSEGVVSIEMVNKSTRILLYPKKPYIILSEESASLIDSSRKVMIEFAVLSDGTVPFSRVNFIPSSLLPQAVQSEIREQVSKWRFSTSSSEALARLEYNIKKR